MSYTKIVDYAAKDALVTGNAAKLIKGTEIGAEFDAIATADALNVKTTALGTGVQTFLATPTSANLAAAVTNETGSGALVFATSPTLVTPDLGTPSAAVLTNASGTAAALNIGGNAATATLATTATTATNQSGGTVNAVGGISRNGILLVSDTAPTIASGFGTSPSILASNGTTAFIIDVGTGGTAFNGVITMPAAPNGWIAIVSNSGNSGGSGVHSVSIARPTNTTSFTITNYTFDPALVGQTKAWTASSRLYVQCFAY